MSAMGRVLKFTRAETDGVTRFGRDSLEEFPDEPIAPVAFANETVEPAEAPPFLDPDAIREDIMAAARADAAAKVKEAYQEGLERGMDAGWKKFESSIARSAEALTAAADAIQGAQAQFLDHLEPQVLQLVKLLVSRVIETECKTNPALIQHTVRRALEQLTGQYAVVLLLHPDDMKAIEEHKIALLDSVPGVESIQIVASDEVAPGGCIARSDAMEVDARLESLLAQALDALTE